MSENESAGNENEKKARRNEKRALRAEEKIITFVTVWFKLINQILSKEKPSISNRAPYTQLQEALTLAVKTTIKYLGPKKVLGSPFGKKSDHP